MDEKHAYPLVEKELSESVNSLLLSGENAKLERLLNSKKIANSENREYYKKMKENLRVLNHSAAEETYGVDAITRFYNTLLNGHKYTKDGKKTYSKLENLLKGVLDKNAVSKEEYSDAYSSEPLKIKRTLFNKAVGWLAFPIKVMSKVYDFTLKNTGSHIASWGASMVAAYPLLETGAMAGMSAYFSYTTGIPFIDIFSYAMSLVVSKLAMYALVAGSAAGVTTFGMLSLESRAFSPRSADEDEIKSDIKRYTGEFNSVWNAYSSRFLSSGDATLDKLNAVYMMVTTKDSVYDTPESEKLKNARRHFWWDRKASKAYRAITMDKIRKNERESLPYIERILGKKTGKHGIWHRCFSGVGGITLIPASLFGKLFRRRIMGKPVFLNTERASAYPSYQFALFHELSHAAGATTEPMANYYAMEAMDDFAADHPFEGYDIYTSVNRLCFAIDALKKKVKDNETFVNSLKEAEVPKFVYESFFSVFDPTSSPLPPTDEIFSGRSIERMFASLYMSSSYFAAKKVEKGSKKLFTYSLLGKQDLQR